MQKSAQLNIELNSKTKSGWTPFHCAANNGKSRIVKLLLQKSNELNIDINARDRLGWTTFHYTCKDGYTEIAEALIKVTLTFFTPRFISLN